MFEKRIKKFIDLINEKNVTWIKASELRCPEDKYDDEFYEEIKKMDVYGILKVRNFTHTHNSNILLTSKGAFLGKCYIDNDVEISKRLNVPRIFVDAVFVDLENQNLVKTKTGIGGMYISKFTDRGNDYLF